MTVKKRMIECITPAARDTRKQNKQRVLGILTCFRKFTYFFLIVNLQFILKNNPKTIIIYVKYLIIVHFKSLLKVVCCSIFTGFCILYILSLNLTFIDLAF